MIFPLNPYRALAYPLAAALATTAACDTDSGVDSDFIQPESGTVAVVLSGGDDLSQVSWTLSGGALDEMMSGTIDTRRSTAADSVAESDRTVTTHISGIPVASGYTIELAGELRGGYGCGGTTQFDIPFAAAVARATIVMNCYPGGVPGDGDIVVIGGVNVCPDVNLVVAPLRTRVGNTIDLSATAIDDDGDPVTYTWSASRGAIAAPSAATTEYTCTDAGEVVIDLITDDGNGCNVARAVTVACTADDG